MHWISQSTQHNFELEPNQLSSCERRHQHVEAGMKTERVGFEPTRV